MKAIYIVKIGSALSSKTTVEELRGLANQNGSTLEIFKSRRGNFQLIKIDGNLVAYGFATQEEAIAYVLTGEAA